MVEERNYPKAWILSDNGVRRHSNSYTLFVRGVGCVIVYTFSHKHFRPFFCPNELYGAPSRLRGKNNNVPLRKREHPQRDGINNVARVVVSERSPRDVPVEARQLVRNV